MSRILCASLLEADGVRVLYEWMQEIHGWGAGRYGPACGEEIGKCLEGKRDLGVALRDTVYDHDGQLLSP